MFGVVMEDAGKLTKREKRIAVLLRLDKLALAEMIVELEARKDSPQRAVPGFG